MRFAVEARCAGTAARAGSLELPRGTVPTPVFMPVGTNATVKTLRPEDLAALGYRLILSNTYHLHLRPGEDVVAGAGGLHAFMGWDGNILTDSGGFQVFSLAEFRKVREHGVEFRSHIDGSARLFTPEKVLEIQRALGSEIVMPLDECTPGDAGRAAAETAERRTAAWAAASRTWADANLDPARQSLFGIVQGNVFPDLRRRSAESLAALDFPGYAIGGLSVGESRQVMYPLVESTAACLPPGKPRYLMGVGEPLDLVHAVAGGIDMFDCVLPTRNARNASLFTPDGPVNLRNERFRRHFAPVDPSCACPACSRYTAAYLRHLFKCGEVLALVLATLHNLAFLARLMAEMRVAVVAGTFPAFRAGFVARYGAGRRPAGS